VGKTIENEWIEVNPSRYRRTKQVKINPSKWQVNIENRYEVLDNLLEKAVTIKGVEPRKIRGITKLRSRNLIKRDHKVLLIGEVMLEIVQEKYQTISEILTKLQVMCILAQV
jgi:F0F1-type ATP synthase membrane subunit a